MIIDEAWVIGEGISIFNKSDDDETIAKLHIKRVIDDYYRAFRSRGIGLLSADQKPSKLFDIMHSIPSLKFIFRTDTNEALVLTPGLREAKSISEQVNRRALLIDGVNGVKYAFRTPDHHPNFF